MPNLALNGFLLAAACHLVNSWLGWLHFTEPSQLALACVHAAILAVVLVHILALSSFFFLNSLSFLQLACSIPSATGLEMVVARCNCMHANLSYPSARARLTTIPAGGD
jgi:hypothetical protein